jgi:hypothetical protein
LNPGEFRRLIVPGQAAAAGAAVVRAEVVGPADRQANVELATKIAEAK